jgi:hypothetical protein
MLIRATHEAIESTQEVINQPGVALRLFKVLFSILVVIVGSAVVWAVGSVEIQRWQVRRTVHSLIIKFPIGIELSQAQASVNRDYPRHTNYSSDDCEKWSHRTTPAYSSRGGPCIFGLVNLESRAHLMEAGVEFKLIFGPDDHLAQLYSDPVYTFL